MITEDYCSYEVAKLLKDKGFDGLCYCQEVMNYDGNFTTHHTEYPENWNQSEPWVSIPTLGMAMKWIREMYNLCISIYYLFPYGYTIDILYTDKDTPFKEFRKIRNNEYDTYEEAVEAALKYCLENLI